MLRFCLALLCGLVPGILHGQGRWQLVEEVRIGSPNPGPTSFGDIRGLATNRLGWVFVLDFETQDIRIFDRTGSFLRTTGGKGTGQGEMRSANGMLQMPNGRIVVNDPANRRITVFGPEGQFQRSLPLSNPGQAFIWDAWADQEGRIVDRIASQPDAPARTLRRVSLTGAAPDTLVLPACGGKDRKVQEPYLLKSNRMTMSLMVPFHAGPAMGFDPAGYVWCGWTSEYRLDRIGLERGDTSATAQAKAKAVPVTPAERDSAVLPALEKFPTARLDLSRIPKQKPLFSRLIVDDQHRLWVLRTVIDGTTFDVFGPKGQWLASATTGVEVEPQLPIRVEGNQLFAVMKDKDDLQYVLRFRIER